MKLEDETMHNIGTLVMSRSFPKRGRQLQLKKYSMYLPYINFKSTMHLSYCNISRVWPTSMMASKTVERSNM